MKPKQMLMPLKRKLWLSGLTVASLWCTAALAAAYETRESVGGLVSQIARSTDDALHHLQDDLIRHRRWKPRGYDGKLWSSLAKLEEYGDSLEKVYRRSHDLRTLGEVSRAISKQLAGVRHWERFTYVSPAVHRDIRRVERAVAILNDLTSGSRRIPARPPAYYDARPDRDNGWEWRDAPGRRDGYRYPPLNESRNDRRSDYFPRR